VQGGQEVMGAQRGRQSTRTVSETGGLGNEIPRCLALRIDAFDPHSLTDKSRIPVSKQKHTLLCCITRHPLQGGVRGPRGSRELAEASTSGCGAERRGGNRRVTKASHTWERAGTQEAPAREWRGASRGDHRGKSW
jgi:hypothetical protein